MGRGKCMKAYKVVFHINELEKWSSLLGNVSNLLADMSNVQIEVEIVANGKAATYYDSTNDVETDVYKLKQLNEQGVKIVGCNNALTGHGITHEELYPFVQVVPAGVSELVKKQNEGYAYIYV